MLTHVNTQILSEFNECLNIFPTVEDVGVELNLQFVIFWYAYSCVWSLWIYFFSTHRNFGIRNVLNLSRFHGLPASLGNIFQLSYYILYKLLVLAFIIIIIIICWKISSSVHNGFSFWNATCHYNDVILKEIITFGC